MEPRVTQRQHFPDHETRNGGNNTGAINELWEKAPLAANPYQTAVWPGINSSQTLWTFEETQRFAVD